MTPRSAKPLFAALRPGRRHPDEEGRRPLDAYFTGEPEAIRALLAADGARIRALGSVWEPAAGRGDMVREIEGVGLPCLASDIADHGWPGLHERRCFYEFQTAPAPAIITNSPYGEITARSGSPWLRHTLALPGWRYCALLLSWEWPAGVTNGLGELLDAEPFAWCYLLRWKIDFTGAGRPSQRNAWFVWDRDWRGGEPAFRWLARPPGPKTAGAHPVRSSRP